jgi:hypothetical protein
VTSRTTLSRLRNAGAAAVVTAAVAFMVILAWAPSGAGSREMSLPKPVLAATVLPLYTIESTTATGTRTMPGVVGVPIPVDVDGDVLPDALVTVTLVNPGALFRRPPDLANVLAPNVVIERAPEALRAGKPAPPVKIVVRLDVPKIANLTPATTLRFGYDTTKAGAIPPRFQATVDGLATLFNPLEAVIDTRSGLLRPGLTPVAYQGPLTLVGEVTSGAFHLDGRLAFDPLPNVIRVGYHNDGKRNYLTYRHVLDANAAAARVDMAANIDVTSAGKLTSLTAQVTRVPELVTADWATTRTRLPDGTFAGSGTVHVTRNSGPAPDVTATVRGVDDAGTPIDARFDIDGVPRDVRGAWDMRGGQLTHAVFTAKDGIGGIDARIANYRGADPAGITPLVPSAEQFADYQETATGQRLIRAHIRNLRSVTLDRTASGIAGSVSAGDGVLPIEIGVHADGRPQGNTQIDAHATATPLPASLSFAADRNAAGGLAHLHYAASQPTTVAGTFTLRDKSTVGAPPCGAVKVVCGDVTVHDVPSSIDVSMPPDAAGLRVGVDTVVAPGNPLPSLGAALTVGPDSVDGRPFVVDGTISGIPAHLRARTIDGPGGGAPQVVSVKACQTARDFRTCRDDLGTIAAVDLSFRNVLRVPAGLPEPTSSAPMSVTVGAISGRDTADMRATVRVEHVSAVEYAGDGARLGLHTIVGRGAAALQGVIDLRRIDIDGVATDIRADATVTPLPGELSLCFAAPNRSSTGVFDAVTAPCDNTTTLGEGRPVPLAFAYDADAGFALKGVVSMVPSKGGAATRLGLDLTGVPRSMHGAAEVPGDNTSELRAQVLSSGGTDLDGTISVEHTLGTDDCGDPAPAGAVTCLRLKLHSLPDALSVRTHIDDTSTVADLQACDFDFDRDYCRDDLGAVGSVGFDVRTTDGTPPATPAIVTPPAPEQFGHMVVRKTAAGQALHAAGRINQLRSASVAVLADGIDLRADAGDGVAPLLVDADVDQRVSGSPLGHLHKPTGRLLVASLHVDPLPAHVEVTQHGRLAGDDDPITLHFAQSGARRPPTVTASVSTTPRPGPLHCTARTSLCAVSTVTALPQAVDAVVRRTDDDIAGGRTARELTADVITLPSAGGAPDIHLDLKAGPAQGEPVVADATLTGLPNYVSVLLRQEGALSSSGDLTDARIAEVALRTCGAPIAADLACISPQPLGVAAVSLRNVVSRPAGTPDPVAGVASAPQYLSIVTRAAPTGGGPAPLLVAARVENLSELRYHDGGDVFGVRATTGNGKGTFLARADLAALPVADLTLGSVELTDPTLSVLATASISPLPASIDACFRRPGGLNTSAGAPAFVAPCTVSDPFDDEDGPGAPAQAPLTVAYRSTGTTHVETDVSATITGTPPNSVTGGQPIPLDPLHIHGHVVVDQLPASLDLHLALPHIDGLEKVVSPVGYRPKGVTSAPGNGVRLTPVTSGPLLARFRSTAPPATVVAPTGGPLLLPDYPSVTVAAELLDGDAYCGDARADRVAICARGTLSDLPTRADLVYDAAKLTDNLVLTTGYDRPAAWPASLPTPRADLTGFALSIITPSTAGHDATVLDIGGEVRDLPSAIHGTLHLPAAGTPDAAAFDLTAPDAIGHVALTVRNFEGVDPLRTTIPGRQGVAAGVTVLQLGDHVRAAVAVDGVRRVGFKPVRAADGTPLATSIVDLDVDPGGKPVRAYVEILPLDASGGQVTSRTLLADVILRNLPRGISLCFRGGRDANAKAPATDLTSFCNGGGDGEGRFEFATADTTNSLDVDAFIRTTTPGSILSGVVHLEGIPSLVQARFPAGDPASDLEFVGRTTSGAPAGLNKAKVEIASFDIDTARTGYSAADLPYTPRFNADAALAAIPTTPHLALKVSDAGMHASALIGGTGASQLQHLAVLHRDQHKECTPDRVWSSRFPTMTGVSYTCILGGLINPEKPAADNLILDLHLHDGPLNVDLANAGLNALPSSFLATLSSAPATNKDGDALPPCSTNGPSSDSRTVGDPTCVPPVLEVDSKGGPSTLYGQLKLLTGAGVDPDTKTLPLPPKAEFPRADLGTAPGSDGSGWTDWGADARGIRGRLILGDDANHSLGVQVGLRLTVPGQLIVESPRTFSGASDKLGDTWSALDFHFGFAARDEKGTAAGAGEAAGLGQLALLVQLPSGDQLVFDDPTTPGRGLRIPGELDADVYLRSHKGKPDDPATKTTNEEIPERILLQTDTRIAKDETIPMELRLRTVQHSTLPPMDLALHNMAAQAEPGTVGFSAHTEIVLPGKTVDVALPSFIAPQTCTDLGSSPKITDLCTHTNIKVAMIQAALNLQPVPGETPHRLDLVARQTGAQAGLELFGWANVDRTGGAMPVGVDGGIRLDPFGLDLNAVDLFQMHLVARPGGLAVHLKADKTKHLVVSSNVLNAAVRNDGPDGATVGAVELPIAEASGAFPLAGGKLAYFDYDANASGGPAQFGWYDCANSRDMPGAITDRSFDVAGGTAQQAMAVILADPRMHVHVPVLFATTPFLTATGAAAGVPPEAMLFAAGVTSLADVARTGPVADVYHGILCMNPRLGLITTGYDADPSDPQQLTGYPSDPVGVTRVAGHPVPNEEEDHPVATGVPIQAAPPAHGVNVAAGQRLELCGLHRFGSITVAGAPAATSDNPAPDGGHIHVADHPISTPAADGSPACPGAAVGRLALFAQSISVGDGGGIDANAVFDSFTNDNTGNTLPANGGGGGHRGEGGTASGTGGTVYGDLTAFEPGQPGGGFNYPGAHGGAGGGVLAIVADTLDLRGIITANGGQGVADPAFNDECDAEGHLQSTGGGSGGTVYLAVRSATGDGTVMARGGDGGPSKVDSGGGGGGGDVIVGGARLGTIAVAAPKGLGGITFCPHTIKGGNGIDGYARSFVQPSTAAGVTRTWANVSSAKATVTGTIPYITQGSSVVVHVCGVHLAPGDYEAATGLPVTRFGTADRSNIGPNPATCGTRATTDADGKPLGLTGVELGTATVTPTNVTDKAFDIALDVSLPRAVHEGYWGITAWTEVKLPAGGSIVEPLSYEVESVLGIDNTSPQPHLQSPLAGGYTNQVSVPITQAPTDELSGIVTDELCERQASGGSVQPFLCSTSSVSLPVILPNTDGWRDLTVKLFDQAGNVGSAKFTTNVDFTLPATDPPTISPGLPASGWYQSAPDVRLHATPAADNVAPAAGFRYRIDGGPLQSCLQSDPTTCDVAGAAFASTVAGHHHITWTNLDVAGNALEEPNWHDVEIPIDRDAPLLQVGLAPPAPGASGWYTQLPQVVASALDQPGGSGSVQIFAAVCAGDPSCTTRPAPALTVGPAQRACVIARDAAGNESAPECTPTVKVDTTPPAGTLSVGGVPSAGGWYGSSPPMHLASAVPGDARFVYQVDDGPFGVCASDCDLASLSDGRHALRWQAFDQAGNANNESVVDVAVDSAAPRSRVLLTRPPEGLDGWHVRPVWAEVTATDGDGSGVASTSVTVDGAPWSYTTPFALPASGHHVVCATSTDEAGNTSPKSSCASWSQDLADPAVQLDIAGPQSGSVFTAPALVTVGATDDSAGVTADNVIVSVDRGPFVPWASSLVLAEGPHVVRAAAVDRAGRRSDVVEQRVVVDTAPPTVAVRTVPAAPTRNGWFSIRPLLVLGGDDGAGTGIATLEYREQGATAWQRFTGPVELNSGLHTIEARATDGVGRVSAVRTLVVRSDVAAPVAAADGAEASPWNTATTVAEQLRWTVRDDLSPKVHINVIVSRIDGRVAARIDGGNVALQPGTPTSGSTGWKRADALPGIYTYAVVATDLAGNVTRTTDSAPFIVL